MKPWTPHCDHHILGKVAAIFTVITGAWVFPSMSHYIPEHGRFSTRPFCLFSFAGFPNPGPSDAVLELLRSLLINFVPQQGILNTLLCRRSPRDAWSLSSLLLL